MAKDLSSWPTKGEVVAQIGISERSLERLIQKKQVRRGYRRVPGRRSLAVLHPDDIEKLKQETLLPLPDSPTGSKATLLPVARQATVANLLAALAVNGTQVPLHRKLYLSVKEAAKYSGLPQAYLRRLIGDGTLTALKAGGYRIRRSDLEKL